MNTTQLECFVAVSTFLNFSRAAEQLRLTQPAVSHQINSLEDELGVKLFHRTSKRVRLTQAGHLFSQYAQEILALSHTSKERLKESRQTSVIHFGIGCRSFLELGLVKPALRQLRSDFPLLRPTLRLVSSPSLESMLEDGDVQVIFTFQETAPKRTTYRELLRQKVVCICGKDHPFAAYDTLTVQQLRTGECLAASHPHSGPAAILELQGRIITGRDQDRICFCDGLETLYALVEAGYAFAVTTDLPDGRSPDICAIPVAGVPAISYGVAYRVGEDHPMLRPFLEQMIARFAAPREPEQEDGA